MRYAFVYIAIALLLAACSSHKEVTISEKKDTSSVAVQKATKADTLSRDEMKSATLDSSLVFADSNYENFVSKFLESARQHYMNALDARESGDSARCGNEFEYAISNLNELGNFPGIDSNQEFTDLSRLVVDDYNKYIATIDSLGAESSVFALRAKLNQMAELTDSSKYDVTKEIIKTTAIPLVINGHVEENIEFLSGRFHDHFQKWLDRSSIYFPKMRQILKEEGVPEELVYLTLVESGVNPHARSWRKAQGMWQFMKGTGALYGLHGNFWYDDRNDFEKATHAAARLFKDLHDTYSDWYLALAAYDGGRVKRGIHKSHSTDYWKMRPFLARETRNYVPLYIASTVIALDPKTYGFDAPPENPLAYDEVKISDCVSLSVIAKCAGTDESTMVFLNPSLLRDCTPPGVKDFVLHVPTGSAQQFQMNYAALPDDQKRNEISYTTTKREALATIAKKYGVSVALLAEVNHLPKSRKVAAGTVLVIPPAEVSKLYEREIAQETTVRKYRRHSSHLAAATPGENKLVYRIKKGDNLGKIAALYHVHVTDLRDWNDLPFGSKIKTGAKLTIYTTVQEGGQTIAESKVSNKVSPKSFTSTDSNLTNNETLSSFKSYTVKKGDTLYSIASTFGVSVKDLRVWNKLKGSRLKIGKSLKINS